jgi:hypothetical protein
MNNGLNTTCIFHDVFIVSVIRNIELPSAPMGSTESWNINQVTFIIQLQVQISLNAK